MIGESHHAHDTERAPVRLHRDDRGHDARRAEIDGLGTLVASRIDWGDPLRRHASADRLCVLPLRVDRRALMPVQLHRDIGERLVDRARRAIAVRQHPVAEGEGHDRVDLRRIGLGRAPRERVVAERVGQRPRGGTVAEFAGEMSFDGRKQIFHCRISSSQLC
jgi:hypothetical protein